MKYKGMAAMLKAGKRPAGVGYADYAEMAKAAGEDPMDEAAFMEKAEDEGEDDDESEEEEAEDTEKSDLDAADLVKAISAYKSVDAALTQAGGSRESYLQARLDNGTITKSERSELGRIWAGTQEEPKQEPLRKSVTERLDDPSKDLVDASEFLDSLVKSVEGSLDDVRGEVLRDGRATRDLLKAQGSLIMAMGAHLTKQDALIKSLAGRLESVEATPVGRRSVGNFTQREIAGRPIAKSVGGGDRIQGDTLSKSQVNAAVRQLIMKAEASRDENAINELVHATAKYEQTGQLAPNIELAIRNVLSPSA